MIGFYFEIPNREHTDQIALERLSLVMNDSLGLIVPPKLSGQSKQSICYVIVSTFYLIVAQRNST